MEGTVPSLRENAEKVGLLYGSDSDVEISTAPAEYAALLIRHCNLLAPNLPWPGVGPQPASAEPVWEDPNIPFAGAHGMRLTGAHLLWHEETPDWFNAIKSRSAAEAAVGRHIALMGAHYAGRMFSWNVVNEAIEPEDGRADGLRNSPYVRKLGPDFFNFAFEAARAADPNALLTYNDSLMEMDVPEHATRRRALLRLLDRLQKADAPIDAVGLQSHISLDGSRFDATLYRGFLREISSRGLKILITELDVFDIEPAFDIATRDADVAAMYSEFLNVALDEPAVASLVTWGLSDRYTWLTPETDITFIRRDGQPARPLPFDASFQPKPAYFAILTALRHAPSRNPL